MEIWKKLNDYPDYEISNLGNVKSLKRKNLIILKPSVDGIGYKQVVLSAYNKIKTIKVHQLVAIAFLNHKIDGHKIVVNHKNFIKTDNRLVNLELVTQRVNCNKKHLKSSSKYTGVSYDKVNKKWVSRIRINNIVYHLGVFKNELEASEKYEEKLKQIPL